MDTKKRWTKKELEKHIRALRTLFEDRERRIRRLEMKVFKSPPLIDPAARTDYHAQVARVERLERAVFGGKHS